MSITDLIESCFQLMGGDFTNAGAASSELKSTLARLGVSQDAVRRAAIAAFEAEMDVIIHAVAGTLHYVINIDEVKITLQTHSNIIAVAVIKGLSGIVITNGRFPEPDTVKKAEAENITTLTTPKTTFETAGLLYNMLMA